MIQTPVTAFFAVTCKDDYVIVLEVVLDDGRGIKREPTDAVVFGEIMQAATSWAVTDPERVPVKSWRLLGVSEALGERVYRDAWRDRGKIEHDMPKAREIHRDMLRAQRAPLLAQLDTEYLRADEAGDQAEKKRISKEKQRLRDVTADPRIDAAKSIEQLKTVVP